ncbi:hypothetical protein BDV93DRAFT_556566 [Ceratobasidium sp. AG-I]|nr:hypothetical protein BDV93DRAFT_556566 [Ceratobasidium sp. AG-I]
MSAVPRSLVHQDPLRVYQFTLQFNLPNTKALVLPLVITGETDFSDPLRIAELIQSHPSPSVLRLAAMQGVRGKALADVLFRFYKLPMSPPLARPHFFWLLSCAPCRKWIAECDDSADRKGLHEENPPSFVLAWADFAYETLLHAPLEISDDLFDWSVLERFEGKSSVCQSCLADFRAVSSQRGVFNEWAQGVRGILKQRLAGLEHLSTL